MNTLKNFTTIFTTVLVLILLLILLPFVVKLDRCVGNCNNFNDLSDKICVPNKTEDLNLIVVNMITGINKMHQINQMHQESMCYANENVDVMEENVIQINGGLMKNVDVSVKKRHACGKDYVWNPTT